MASVRKRGNYWHYRICINNGDGTYYRAEKGGFLTKGEAAAAGQALENEIKRGGMKTQPKNMTFDELTRRYRVDMAIRYKKSTIDGYEHEWQNIISPMIGLIDIQNISTERCQKIILEMIRAGYSANRISKVKSVIRQTFEYAIEKRWLRTNPADKIKIPSRRSEIGKTIKPAREQRSITREEIDEIFERFPAGTSCFFPLLLGYRAGCRLGEAFAICEEDFDAINCTITINRQIQYTRESGREHLYITDPKYDGFRTLELDMYTSNMIAGKIERNRTLRAAFPGYRHYYIDEKGVLNENGNGQEIHFLNVKDDGTYITPRAMCYASRVIHGHQGVFDNPDPLWDFHSLRHTHASELLAAGVDPVEVQARLGHKRLETVYRYYVHSTEETKKRMSEALKNMN